MKAVGNSDRAVEITGVSETKQMTIHADARMFKNLLDSIYSEKEKTVVRELMANAFDAHIEGGCPDREIEVHLPTIMDPTFVVRDYGSGMTHDFMMNLYSALGFSSKNETNGQTGMFGVGSKSPLSITDSFTVKAFDGDQVRTYIITIPSDEHPQISYAFTTKKGGVADVRATTAQETPWTDGPVEVYAPLPGVDYSRGIEVTVPLDLKRRAAVLDGLASQHFCWFDKKVKFLGALDEIKHKFYTSIARMGDGLYLATPSNATEDRYSSYHSSTEKWNVFVRQGAAVYPLNESQIKPKLNVSNIDVIKQLCTNGRHVLIDLPLGTANVTLAREAISYDTTSLANIVKVIGDCFKGFAEMLEATVGDARDFYLAQKRIAEKFYPPGESERFASQRMASTLLGLCEKKVISNWEAWFKAQPDIILPEIDPNTGKPTGKKVMGRPLAKPPRRQVEMRTQDFPEGKVLLHKGTMDGGGSFSSVKTSIGGAESYITFRAPCVIFVLPSHLKEWKDRVQDYCKDTFKNEIMLSGGVPIQVVRCAKRNVDEVQTCLHAAGVLTKAVVMEELPNIAPADIRKRNFSKTSVYPWKTSTWEETKIEPNYDLPAYYLARVGIAHDVHLSHPTKLPPVSALQRQTRTTNHNVQHLISDGVRLGFIDSTYPVYRVTENQATRIAETCTKWIHLGSELADKVESKIASNMRIAIGKSRLGNIGGGLLPALLPSVKLAGELPSDVRGTAVLELVKELVDADPLFEMVAAIKLAVIDEGATFKEDTTFDRLYRALFTFSSQVDREKVSKYEALEQAFNVRYMYLTMFADGDGRHGTSWLPHARLYLDGAWKMWHKEKLTINLDEYGELKPFVAAFSDKIDAIDVKRAKALVITEEEDNDVVQPPRRRANLR